jgi:acetolactate synthase-1/2/3 large subunit
MRMENPAIDLGAIARAQGAEAGDPVEKVGELLPALNKGIEAVARGKVYLLDVHIAPGAGKEVVLQAG